MENKARIPAERRERKSGDWGPVTLSYISAGV